MGIIVPRPAMRRGEERRVHEILRKHAILTEAMTKDGVPREQASLIAVEIVRTKKRRDKIWRTR